MRHTALSTPLLPPKNGILPSGVPVFQITSAPLGTGRNARNEFVPAYFVYRWERVQVHIGLCSIAFRFETTDHPNRVFAPLGTAIWFVPSLGTAQKPCWPCSGKCPSVSSARWGRFVPYIGTPSGQPPPCFLLRLDRLFSKKHVFRAFCWGSDGLFRGLTRPGVLELFLRAREVHSWGIRMICPHPVSEPGDQKVHKDVGIGIAWLEAIGEGDPPGNLAHDLFRIGSMMQTAVCAPLRHGEVLRRLFIYSGLF